MLISVLALLTTSSPASAGGPGPDRTGTAEPCETSEVDRVFLAASAVDSSQWWRIASPREALSLETDEAHG